MPPSGVRNGEMIGVTGEMTGEIYIREVLGWMEEMKPVQSK